MVKQALPGFHEVDKQVAFHPETAGWPVGEAKARFSELVASAHSGPQTITRNGKPVDVVVSVEEWAKKQYQRKGNLVDFLMNSPLRDSGLDLERVRDQPREIEL